MKYYYTREIVNNAMNIDNPARVDESGEQIYLLSEVSNALNGKIFKMYCLGENVIFNFSEELSDDEKIILDDCVYNHKNNL